MIDIEVWLTLEDGSMVKCGEIVCREPDSRGRIRGAFRYAPSYLSRANAFSIDPVSLPLSSDVFETTDPSGLHGVFSDALPDTWGRRLLVKKSGLPPERQRAPHLLLALGSDGLGALSFFKKGVKPPDWKPPSDILLPELINVARRVERGESVDDPSLRPLLVAGSSPGGARPKALIVTDDGVQWIAKFPSIQDRLPIVRIEAATMHLAGSAGVNVPTTRLVTIPTGEALLVQRFDVSDDGGRHHMISMQTLLQAGGWYTLGYQDLFDIVRKYGNAPEIDGPALYRQMVFNALIGNTDDHLQNFSMLQGIKGLRLSPAYDLLPDTANRLEHVLHFNHSFIAPGRRQLTDVGHMLSVFQPGRIVEQVAHAIGDWFETFRSFGIDKPDCDWIAKSINRRLAAF